MPTVDLSSVNVESMSLWDRFRIAVDLLKIALYVADCEFFTVDDFVLCDGRLELNTEPGSPEVGAKTGQAIEMFFNDLRHGDRSPLVANFDVRLIKYVAPEQLQVLVTGKDERDPRFFMENRAVARTYSVGMVLAYIFNLKSYFTRDPQENRRERLLKAVIVKVRDENTKDEDYRKAATDCLQAIARDASKQKNIDCPPLPADYCNTLLTPEQQKVLRIYPQVEDDFNGIQHTINSIIDRLTCSEFSARSYMEDVMPDLYSAWHKAASLAELMQALQKSEKAVADKPTIVADSHGSSSVGRLPSIKQQAQSSKCLAPPPFSGLTCASSLWPGRPTNGKNVPVHGVRPVTQCSALTISTSTSQKIGFL